MSGKAYLAIATVLALVPLLPCGAQGIAHRQPVVLVLVHSSTQGDNQQLGNLIADSFKVELESQGIRVLPSDESAADDSAIASLAEKSHADFALCGMYTLAGSEIQLDARWIDPVKKAAAAIASRKGALNLSFDAVVASLVDEIVEGQKEGFANLPPEQIGEISPLPASAQQPAAARTASVVVDSRPALLPAGGAQKAETSFAPLSFSLGSAPFIATFTALNYFPLGLNISFTGLYRIRVPGGLFGFGLSSGFSGFHGKVAYAEADFYVVPIGIDLSYGTRTGSAIDFFLHVGGGPAVFNAKPTSGNSQTEVIPYATGGVGILLSLIDSLAISLEGGYTCFFDPLSPIMGFAPALSVLVRL